MAEVESSPPRALDMCLPQLRSTGTNSSLSTHSTSDSDAITEITRQFTIFPKFPPEIREMIWAEGAFGRAITIWDYEYEELDWEGNNMEARNNNPLLPHFSSSSVYPAILQASRESRRVALRSYQFFFNKRRCPDPFHRNPQRPASLTEKQLCWNPFYFNPAVDTIFLRNFWAYEAFMAHTSDCDEMKLIRYLAVRIDLHFGAPLSQVYEDLARFVNLESLIIHFSYKTGPGLEPMERFEVRQHLQRFWKKDKNGEEDLEKKIVMQNPDIVFLGEEEMKIMDLVI